MNPKRYRIVVKRYGRYWEEEEETLFTGATKDQMLNLFDRFKDMQGPKTISLRLEDEGGTTIEERTY